MKEVKHVRDDFRKIQISKNGNTFDIYVIDKFMNTYDKVSVNREQLEKIMLKVKEFDNE